MSAPSKRQSTAPAAPKPPVNFSSSLTIPRDASLTGTHSITIQAETLVHPRAVLDSTHTNLLIGRRCVIQERAWLGGRPQDTNTTISGGISLGDYVVVKTGSQIDAGATEVGEGTVIEVGCRIGSGAKIGKVRTNPVERLPEALSDFYRIAQFAPGL